MLEKTAQVSSMESQMRKLEREYNAQREAIDRLEGELTDTKEDRDQAKAELRKRVRKAQENLVRLQEAMTFDD